MEFFALKINCVCQQHTYQVKKYRESDQQSIILQDATEWKLHPELFHKIADNFGKPDIDLCASRINRQVKRYVSWHPEPEVMAVNAFSYLE